MGDIAILENIILNCGEGRKIKEFLEPMKTLALSTPYDNPPKVEILHRDCVVYEMPLE